MFQVGDRVEVVGDRRAFLNGRRGVIIEIVGNAAQVEFDDMLGRTNRAKVLLDNLKKI